MRYLLLAFGLAFMLTDTVSAADTARKLYVRGAYDAAAASAVARPGNNTGEPDYALAARSMLAKVYYLPDMEDSSSEDRLLDLKQARQWAEFAVEHHPDQVEGYLQLVVALGHEGLNRGALAVFFGGIIGRSRDLLVQARELDPDSPWVHGLIGGWNLELVRQAGVAFARDNKASLEQGMAAYEQALQLAPENALLRTEFALTLLLMDRQEYQRQAMDVLGELWDAQAESQVEQIARARGQQALKLLETGDTAGLDRFLARIDRLRSVE